MKVYFINPPASIKITREGRCMVKSSAWTVVLPPISLASCAATLRENKFEVKITDCIVEKIKLQGLGKKIKKYNPNLIILNTSTPSIKEDLNVVRLAKKINSNIKVGVIGIHVSSLPDETFFLSRKLDYIIRNEPEFTIRDLALNLKGNGSLSKIKGISYRKNKKIFHNSSRETIPDLDLLPFPAWDLIDISKYKMPFTKAPFLLIAPSRGCPHRCTFCTGKVYYGKKLRLRLPSKIVDEIEWSINKFKVKDFLFWSDSFTLDKKFVLSVADEILKRNLKIRWVCNSRVDSVGLELLKKIKEAGCWMIGFGIESGNQKILDFAMKGINLKQTINAVKLAKKAGLEISAQCILGLPGETKKTALQTISFIKKLDVDYAQFYCAVPFPGSDLYKIAKEKKWIKNKDWSKFNQSESIMNTDSLKAEEVMWLRKKAYFNYYFNLKQILKSLRKIKSLSGFKDFLYMVKDFLFWILR